MSATATLLSVEHVSLSFGGVRAISRRVVRHPQRRDPRDHRAERRRQDLDAERHQRLLPSAKGAITYRGRTRVRMRPHEAAAQGIARTFQNVALFKGMTTLDNIMTGRSLRMNRDLFWQALRLRSGARRGNQASRASARRSSTSSRSSRSARRRSARCPTACRSASSSAGRWRWSRSSCCSTSRWRA